MVTAAALWRSAAPADAISIAAIEAAYPSSMARRSGSSTRSIFA
jgi:hypothetical protein